MPTFKNDYPTGRYRSFSHVSADIKEDGKKVGSIQHYKKFNQFCIQLHVKDETDGSGFKNITLAKRFGNGFNDHETLKEAKEWIKKNWAAIKARYDLHGIE